MISPDAADRYARGWYAYTQTATLGPHTAAEIRDLASIGHVRLNATVQSQETGERGPLHRFAELVPDVALRHVPVWPSRPSTIEDRGEESS